MAFALGCLCSAALVEGSLRLFGEKFRARGGPPTGAATVLCLGNSFTAGIGADPGHSYCDYLQRYIDQDQLLSPLKLRVLNLGESSKNSAMILDELPAALDKYRPRLALLMIGEPNQWNRVGFSRSAGKTAGPWARLLAIAHDSLAGLRLHRFATLAIRDLSAKEAALSPRFPHVSRENTTNLGFRWLGHLYEPNSFGGKRLTEDESREALASLAVIAERYPRNPVIPLAIARQTVPLDQGEAMAWYEKSARIFEAAGVYPYEVEIDIRQWQNQGIAFDPARIHGLLARIRTQHRSDTLSRLAKKIGFPRELSRLLPLGAKNTGMATALASILEAYPGHVHLRRHLFNYHRERGHRGLANELVLEGAEANPLAPNGAYVGLLAEAQTNRRLEGGAVERALERIKSEFPDEASSFDSYSSQTIAAWTRRDLDNIAAILRFANVPAIWQTYPPLRNGERQWVDPLIQEIAARENAPLSDTYANLRKKFPSTADLQRIFSDHFGSTDPHLNNGGNELVARHLMEVVRAFLLSGAPSNNIDQAWRKN